MQSSKAWFASLAALALGVSMVGVGSTASAHHSFSMFDATKEQTVTGRVVAFKYGNPHVMLTVDVNGRRYLMEGPSPSILNNLGWSRTSIRAGDVIKVKFHPLRNGSPGGNCLSVTLSSGEVMSMVREDITY